MQPLLLVVLALCAAPIFGIPSPDYDPDYNDENEKRQAASWEEEEQESAPPEPNAAVVPIPGIGQILGVRNYKTIAGRSVNAFLGVRYGQVGSGLARFQAAQPANLQGRIDATVQSPNCAQFPELQRLRESESRGENVDDCLTLNIYAPEGAKDLPVLVFVHGEMLFDGGAEEAQPDYVLEKDVLLVSINYRLAPFGFLSALSDELPGNVALSDLQLALEWLQRNLAYFGGNPGQVTLAGQAGGATLVHALSLSGRASGLFQQLILQSGTALNPYLIDERPLDTLNTFARLARCPTNPTARSLAPLYDCLASLPTSQLVAAFEQLFEQNEPHGLTSLGGFKLVVGDRLGYLPRSPVALAANGSNSVPTIVGAAKDASAFILSRFYNQIAGLQSRNVSDYIDVVLRHTAPPSEHRIWKHWALHEIFSPELEYSATARAVTQGLLELSNIILYRAPVIFSIRQSYRSTPVYIYTFDYRGEHHRFGHLNNPLPFGVDASLSDDSVYLFPYPVEASRLNPVDRSLSRALVTMWVNFAVSGVPNPNSGVWPRATSEYGPFLRFTNSRQNMLELDPHFGEGINLPNLYGEYFNTTTSSSRVAVATPTRPYTYPTHPTYPTYPTHPTYPTYPTYPTTTTTTTTTTTRRPYAYNPYANWQSRQPQPTWRPANPDYVRAQEERQAQFIRDQQLRAQREREQRWREQQQRNNQNRGHVEEGRGPSQVPREQQRQDQEQQQREKEQREQWRLELVQRTLQQLEQQERERQQREQQERERQEREQQEREQQEREQQEREQQEREQQEREQQEREQQWRERDQSGRDENPNNELQPYPTYDDYLRNQPDESPESTPDRSYDEEQESEAQRREQQQREQEERLEEERLQQEREREQQPDENPDDGRQPYEDPSYEEYLKSQQGENAPDTEPERNYNEEQDREQQQREQQEREQQEREQQEREQQEREQNEREPQHGSDDPRNYPSYDEYLRAQQGRHPAESDSDADEQNREQERRDQLDHEQEEPAEYNPEDDGDDQEPTDPANDPSSYPSYEAYVQAQEKMRAEEEERDRAQEARERAEEEQEETRQGNRDYSQLWRLHNEPQHIKLMHHRQQRRRQ